MNPEQRCAGLVHRLSNAAGETVAIAVTTDAAELLAALGEKISRFLPGKRPSCSFRQLAGYSPPSPLGPQPDFTRGRG
jgi:hypothetical protein